MPQTAPTTLLAALTALLLSPVSHLASAQCRPPSDSHEARLLALYAVPIVFSANPAAIAPTNGRIRLSLEGAVIPEPSASLQHTEYCYTGNAEHTDLTRVFGRPRLTIGLPFGIGVEASYLPPITIGQATPNLVSGALWITHSIDSHVALTVRAHGTTGTVRGPITCPQSALQQQDPEAPCYGTSESQDTFKPNMAGGEVIASTVPRGPASRFSLSAGIGVNALRPRFRVGFSDLLGGTDHTMILVNLTRVTALAAATIRLTSRCDLSTEGFASLSDAMTVRGMMGCALLR